jgi:hypothetical protein
VVTALDGGGADGEGSSMKLQFGQNYYTQEGTGSSLFQEILEVDLNVLSDRILDSRNWTILSLWSARPSWDLIICESFIVAQRRNALRGRAARSG